MPQLALTDEVLERIEGLDATALELLGGLPPRAREAVKARVVDERDYPDIARDLRCSEAVVRKRVSRGLKALRNQMEENR
jgi:RNA polymerase sigma-70 factor (ECF subfamily)